MTISMAIALTKIMQRGPMQTMISRQYKRRRKSKDDIGTEESSNQDINNELSDDSYAVEDDDNKYEGFAFLHDDMVCSTQDKAGIPKAGSYWTASPLWMCSLILAYLQTFEMPRPY